MTHHSQIIEVKTAGKGTYEITQQIAQVIRSAPIQNGIATIFNQHVSASLIVFENADHSTRIDLEAYFDRLAPEGGDFFNHPFKGSENSAAHIRTVLTGNSKMIPIIEGQLQLGPWQGIFLFEHRGAPHCRSIVVTLIGT